MSGIDDTKLGYARVAQEGLTESHPVNRVIRRLPYQLVVPRGFAQVQAVGPVVWVRAENDLKTGLAQTGDRIWRGHFDPVHLAVASRCLSCGRLRRRKENHLI